MWREIAFGTQNPHPNLYRFFARVSTTRLKFTLVGAGSALSWFQDSIGILLSFLIHLGIVAPLWGEVKLWMCMGMIGCHSSGIVPRHVETVWDYLLYLKFTLYILLWWHHVMIGKLDIVWE